MRRLWIAPLIAALSLSAAPAFAQARGVGLGAAAGVAIPDGKISFDPAFNWGFFVDIPLISTFHITPSTLIYNLNVKDSDVTAYVTDISLNFKFMVPLGFVEPFAGVTGGLTVATEIFPHVGLVAGASFRVIANLDLYIQANYKLVLDYRTNTIDANASSENLRDLQIYVGPLFRF
jgi:hypothetical protein